MSTQSLPFVPPEFCIRNARDVDDFSVGYIVEHLETGLWCWTGALHSPEWAVVEIKAALEGRVPVYTPPPTARFKYMKPPLRRYISL